MTQAQILEPQSLQGFGIAVTRPVDQATKLNARIAGCGGMAIAYPLIDIRPLTDYQAFDETLKAVADTDWAIFISSNAVQNGLPRVLNRYKSLPSQLKFAAIGPVTAQELLALGKPAGLQQVLTPTERFDSESLLNLPQMQMMQGKKVMIFRGIGGREVLANTLIARGAKVCFAECYQRVNPQTDCSLIATLVAQNKCHAIVVTSSEAMRFLLALANDAAFDPTNVGETNPSKNNAAWLKSVAICVNHARIAEEATWSNLSGLKLHVAEAPGDAAMLACIKKALLN